MGRPQKYSEQFRADALELVESSGPTTADREACMTSSLQLGGGGPGLPTSGARGEVVSTAISKALPPG